MLNILEKFSFRMGQILQVNVRKPFGLQRSEERLGDRIVPTVSLSAHALNQFHPRDCRTKRFAAVLHSAVGMNDATCRQLSPPESPLQGHQDAFMAQGRTDVPPGLPCAKKGL